MQQPNNVNLQPKQGLQNIKMNQQGMSGMSMGNQMAGQLSGQLLNNQMPNQMPNQMAGQLNNQLTNQMTNQMGQTNPSAMLNILNNRIGPQILQQQQQQHQQQQSQNPMFVAQPSQMRNQQFAGYPNNEMANLGIGNLPQVQLMQSPSVPESIKEVWNDNLYEEFEVIRQLVKRFKFISLSVEIPGIIARPIGKFATVSDFHYQTMRVNSDILNMIQLSITLSDANGKKPSEFNSNLPSTWQFNFKFDLKNEMFSNDTINDLKLTGIQFDKLEKDGIEHKEFSQLLYESGLILDPKSDITWISFNCGYDFGFFISSLTNNAMPNDSEAFLWWCQKFFINFFDVKYISIHQSNIFSNISNDLNNGGELNFKRFNLENLADNLGIPVQQSNFLQSGNQSILTNICFFELKRLISLSSNQKDLNTLLNFKNLVWGIDKNNDILLQNGGMNGYNMGNIVANDSNGGNLLGGNMIGTPMSHPMNMINVNSPIYLSR